MLSFDFISEPPTQFATAQRQQRTHALNTTLSQVAVKRRLAAAETTCLHLETRLREQDSEIIECLDADRRWISEREQEEREEKEHPPHGAAFGARSSHNLQPRGNTTVR